MQNINILHSVGLDIDKPPMLKERTRTLNHHALMYILEGKGSFEDAENKICSVSAGTAFYLHPGRWHRFDPDPKTTWTEYWILFDGQGAKRCFGELLPGNNSIYDIGIDDEIIDAYEKLFELWFLNSPPNQLILNYFVHSILSLIYIKIKRIKLQMKDDLISKATSQMKYSLQNKKEFDPLKFSKQEGLSYEAFRKKFKNATNQAPNQFYLQMKINKSKNYLLRPNLNINEVAAMVGISDPYYFSRIFKNKVGVSPNNFRKKMLH